MNGLNTDKLAEFCRIMEIPDFIRPWLDRFYEEQEIGLVLNLADVKKQAVRENELLDRSFRRGVIDFDENDSPIPAGFHARYEIWSLMEGRQDVPEEIIIRLNRLELDRDISRHRELIERAKITGTRNREDVWPEYVLLHEALTIIEQIPHIYLWPCNCRAMVKGCHKPNLVCLRFDNERGLGWEISRERAGDILKEGFKKGLMQSAELGILPDGTVIGGICSCCPDCCFPQQLSRELDLRQLWPLMRYLAAYDQNSCLTCGRCASRCPFGAFCLIRETGGVDQERVKRIQFNAELCRGCGLCAGTCKAAAISMQELERSPLSLVSELLAQCQHSYK